MRVKVKQPLSFWADLTSSPFSGQQTPGSETNIIQDSAGIKRVQGATLADSAVVTWEILHPDDDDTYTASYVSSDKSIATVNAEGVLTVVSDGTVEITVTLTRASDGTSNAGGSAGEAFTNSLETLISSSDPATALPRFSSKNIATKTFTRNEDFWGKGLTGLSAISPNNSRQANRRCGTALTKRHVMLVAHYPLRVGDTIDFVSNVSGSTTAVTRTIQKVKTHPLYKGRASSYFYDIQIALLDSDLPSDIDIMEVVPSNSAYYGIHNWCNTSIVSFNQYQEGTTRKIKLGDSTGGSGSVFKDSSYDAIGGENLILGRIASGSLYNSPSKYISTTPISKTNKIYELNKSIIVGDSGCPNCFVLGSKLVLIGLHTGPGYGMYVPYFNSDIQQLIIDVDTLAGISTGYTLTECNLSAYPTY